MRTTAGIGDLPVADVVAALGGSTPTPAAGSATAVTVALAAGLVAKCARKAAAAEDVVARAEGWQRRALALADADAERFAAVLEARRGGAGPETLEEAADPPLAVAELAVDVAAGAADMAAGTKPALRADALTAALLAESAACAAAVLVEVNLTQAAVDDGRTRRSRELRVAASEARRRAESAQAGGGR